MNLPTLGLETAASLFATEFLAQLSVVLILLIASALTYRSSRERFLLAWLYGWLAYLVYELALASSAVGQHRTVWEALAHVAFLVAVSQFAASVLFYAEDTRRLMVVAGLASLGVVAALLHDVIWTDSAVLYGVMYACSLAMAAIAGVRLLAFMRGRSQLGPALLVVSLLALHPHDTPAMTDFLPAMDAVAELVLGFSMLVMVMEGARARSHRLNLMSAINNIIAQAEDPRPMVERALRELMSLMRADAAWVRFLGPRGLELEAATGLSDSYLAERRVVPLDSFSGRVLRDGTTGVIRSADAPSDIGVRLKAEGFEHVVVVPMRGKTSAVGTLATASRRVRHYTIDEKNFLTLAAGQLGIAIENMRMFDQVLRAKMQWVSTFDSLDDALLVHDRDNRILRVNRALVDKLKKHPAEVVDRPAESVLPGGGEAWHGCPYCTRGTSGLEAPDPCLGGYSVVSTSSYTDPERSGTIHIVRDTTLARAAEQRYRQLFSGMQEGVFLSSEEGQLLDCNDAFVRLLGYPSKEELLRVDIGRELYVDPERRAEFCRQMAAKLFVRGFESVLRRKDGKLITIVENSTVTRSPEGKLCYQGFLLDITEQKAAEEQTRRRNRELFALNRILTVAAQSFDLDEILNLAVKHVVELFEADTGGAYLFDAQRRVLERRAAYGHISKKALTATSVEVPPALLETIRQSHTEILTQQHMPFLPPAVRDLIAAEDLHSWMWVILWANDEAVGMIGIATRGARDFSTGDENLMIAIGRQLAVTVEKVRLYEATMRAYEELQRTQEQLLQSEKMSAIGQLISGVAHELNNPLTAILGYAQLIEAGATPDRVTDFAGKLYRQAQRTQKIVQNLLSFARQRQPEQRSLDICKVIDDTITLRDYDLKLNNIGIDREYEPHLPQVMADPHQLEQVFLNLINNAVDAILETQRKGRITVRCYAQDSQVIITLRDSGPGITDPARVFDPFYTTKPLGKGTGLGLSICYSIVKQHGGEIAARNHPAGGAVFELRLPTAASGTTRVGDLRFETPQVALSGRILLVDDEEAVLDFESEVLRAGGAEVIATTRGDEAFERLQNENFDAVITDAKMPGKWTGLDLYRWLANARPELRRRFVLTVSNVSDPEIATFLQETHVACMVKPFEMTEFLSLVRRIMQNTRAAAQA